MSELARIADDRGIALIEDAAQAHGARWRGRRAGSFGVASCFSFYPGKNLGAFGDAGAVVTDDAALERRVRCLANHGRADGGPNVHERIGRNSRLDTLQAGVLSAKLAVLDEWNGRRGRVADAYRSQLPPSIAPVEITPAPTARTTSSWCACTIAIASVPRSLIGISRPGSTIPCRVTGGVPTGRSLVGPPWGRAAATEILSLPMFPHMTDEQLWSVCAGSRMWDRWTGGMTSQRARRRAERHRRRGRPRLRPRGRRRHLAKSAGRAAAHRDDRLRRVVDRTTLPDGPSRGDPRGNGHRRRRLASGATASSTTDV